LTAYSSKPYRLIGGQSMAEQLEMGCQNEEPAVARPYTVEGQPVLARKERAAATRRQTNLDRSILPRNSTIILTLSVPHIIYSLAALCFLGTLLLMYVVISHPWAWDGHLLYLNALLLLGAFGLWAHARGVRMTIFPHSGAVQRVTPGVGQGIKRIGWGLALSPYALVGPFNGYPLPLLSPLNPDTSHLVPCLFFLPMGLLCFAACGKMMEAITAQRLLDS